MALITTEVRTCAELKYELEDHSVDDTTFNSRLKCRIMNDLDCNEEGFWYHPNSPFFDISLHRNYMSQADPNHTYYEIDGGRYETDPITHAEVLVGNNAITNVYTYPNSALFTVSGNNNNANYCPGGLRIRNLDIEIVLNQSSIMVSGSAWGSCIFENCNFNIKIVGFPNQRINDWLSPGVFSWSNSGSLGSSRSGHLRFINCTFNVEIVGSPVRKHMGLLLCSGSSYSYAGISCGTVADACEFRIKNMTDDCTFCIFGNVPTAPTGRASGDSVDIYVNNCAVFCNNYKPATGSNALYVTSANTSSYKFTIMNSFFAAFANTADGTIDAEYRSIIIHKDTYATGVFYDSDRLVQQFITSCSERGQAHYALTTAECKSESKLREIGFLFATES